MRLVGISFSGDVCGRGSVHMCVLVCALWMNGQTPDETNLYPIHMPVFIRDLQHCSVLLTAVACNWLTELNISGLDR